MHSDIVNARNAKLDWLASVFSADELAISDEQANTQLFDRENDFGLDHFGQNTRALVKLREARGELEFSIGSCRHTDADRSYASLMLGDEHIFELVVRFEEALPARIKYWSFYSPLPAGVEVRPYEPGDAPGCAALERVCPMEMLNGGKWFVDRGAQFDDYLALMEDIDAAVVVANNQVVGFFSCGLQPIHLQHEDVYCVYQHHYRVHPDFRSGSVSMALSSYVDPRRTFSALPVQFPYSLIDPNNAHMQNMGMPAAENISIARLAIRLDNLAARTQYAKRVDCVVPELSFVCDLLNETHRGRTFYRHQTPDRLQARLGKIESYNVESFIATENAVMGVWRVNELNLLERAGEHQEMRLAFVLDYGFVDPAGLVQLVCAAADELLGAGATHLCFLLDERAKEFSTLRGLADDVQSLNVHTLPWITEVFSEQTVYCDAVYC